MLSALCSLLMMALNFELLYSAIRNPKSAMVADASTHQRFDEIDQIDEIDEREVRFERPR